MLGKRQGRKEEDKDNQQDQKKEMNREPSTLVLLSYTGLNEKLHRAYKKHSISRSSKAEYIVLNAVVNHKDPHDPQEKCGVIYECNVCEEWYVGETERSLEQAQEDNNIIIKGDSKSSLKSTSEQYRTSGC